MKMHEKISIDTIHGGEAVKIANGLIDEIVLNLQDPDTDPMKPRKLVLQVSFEPKKEAPQLIEMKISGKSVLAPKTGSGGIAIIGHDHGEVGLFQDMGIQGEIFPGEDREVKLGA